MNTAIANVEIDREAALKHATEIIFRVCCLAAAPEAFDRTSGLQRLLRRAIRYHDTPALFDHLLVTFSYQGVSDVAAETFMARHGTATWAMLSRDLNGDSLCQKLISHWAFESCGYEKKAYRCNEPRCLRRCPLPCYDLRNGRLNQLAFSFYLFVRDVADGDLVAWIDAQLRRADDQTEDRVGRMRDALLGPLRHVHGVSDKVLSMAFADLLLSAPAKKRRWHAVGASMIAVDTLVHQFLHRSGVLHRHSADHLYGPGCYGPRGCAAILAAVSARIDARMFSARFPKAFPRFVQHTLWRFCSQTGLNHCNGNRIDDRFPCASRFCQIGTICDRAPLKRFSSNEPRARKT